ncbi:hypothetical protein N7475_005347 [Penicillium sp. IBT 31633x]|nr:hypothetical protein N7475_005347 [Penicillium sp. IBT 31633x]
MADDTSSLCDLIEDLGFLPSEHQFLLQLFSSSDPFAGLPGADLEPNHSEVESLQRISIDLAHEIPSVGLRQEVFSLVERLSRSERANQSHLSSTQPPTRVTTQGLEGRNSAHYEEEWISLIAADSESLICELSKQPVSDDETPRPGSLGPSQFAEASGNIACSNSALFSSSSVYDSEPGELPDSLYDCNETPGAQDPEVSQDPRTSNDSWTFEELLESFPTPPARDQTIGERTPPHIVSETQRVLPKDSTRANTPIVISSQVNSVTSSYRTSRFSENLGDSDLIGEQDSSISAKADTSALDISGLANTPYSSLGISSQSSIGTSRAVYNLNISLQAPPPLPRGSIRDLFRPVGHLEGSQENIEDSPRAQERATQYKVFPTSSSIRPISCVLRSQDSFASIFKARSSTTTSPRYYRQHPLRNFPRASLSSFTARKRITPKRKAVLKRVVEKLRHLLRQTRKSTLSSSKH